MSTILGVLLVFAIGGHVTVWAALWNRLHGFGLSFGICSRLTALLVALGAVIPTSLISLVVQGDLPLFLLTQSDVERSQLGLVGAALTNGYMGLCFVALPFAVGYRLWKKLQRQPGVVAHHSSQKLFDLTPRFKERIGRGKRGRAGVLHLWSLVRRKAGRRWRYHSDPSGHLGSLGVAAGCKARNAMVSPDWGVEAEKFPVQQVLPPGGAAGGVRGEASQQAGGRRDQKPSANVGSKSSSHAGEKSAFKRPDGSLGRVGRYSFSPLLRLPANESLSCYRVHLTLDLAALAPSLEGLTIVQLSDLHFIGKIPQEFYQEVVEHTNRENPDLIVITGDIVDRPECIPQAQELLAPLRARCGVYFILGNHDLRAGADRVRSALSELGFRDVGGKVAEIHVRDGALMLIGGTERPWLEPAPHFPPVSSDAPNRPFRLLLAHTPDQFRWAIAAQIDLVLAGHTHGGQACFPGLGPIIAPSAYGIRYAQGVFHHPPTTMYVSRGIGAEFPVRYFCPPELTCLRLTRTASLTREA